MTLSRRTFLHAAGALAIMPIAACGNTENALNDGAQNTSGNGTSNGSNTATDSNSIANPAPLTHAYHMPDEGGAHAATWMAFGATANAWGTTGIYGASRGIARKDLLRIAANLSRFEQVNMLVNDQIDLAQAQQLLTQIRSEPTPQFAGTSALPAIESAGAIRFIVQALDDLWIRDTGPVFVRDKQNGLYGVNFNFNGWGQQNTGAAGWSKDTQKAANGILDQPIAEDQQIADAVLKLTSATKLSTWLVLEGGGIEVNGKGTAICSESCILNPNRNPGRSKAEVEAELQRLLGIQKVIWLPGVKAKDITDGHVDFYARFTNDTTVVYTLDDDPQSPDHAATLLNQQILTRATDAQGNKITAIPLHSPDFSRVQAAVESRNGWHSGASFFNTTGFAAGYVGFYVIHDCVLMAQFGDTGADQAAFSTLQNLYPTRTVIQITTDGIANGGGTIHCATQQQI